MPTNRGRKRRHTLSVELVTTLLDYDPTTGVLSWARDWYIGKKGNPVYPNKRKDRFRIEIAGRLHSYARVCWMRYFLEDPSPDIIDHISGDSMDNRIANLRRVSQEENARNHKRQRNNTSGKSGVKFNKESQKWVATIGNPRVYLGRFETKEEAIEARLKAEQTWGMFRPRDAA